MENDTANDPQLWAHRLSASFSAMASDIAAASQALSIIPPSILSAPGSPAYEASFSSTASLEVDVAALSSRLQAIETRQDDLGNEIQALKDQLGHTQPNGNGSPESKAEELEKKLTEIADTIKLDQQRLYARMYNAGIKAQKSPIKPLPMANGKPPPNFPGTKGEFEHLTRERYEELLKAYKQPTKGDTDAKKETLRVFLGIPDFQ